MMLVLRVGAAPQGGPAGHTGEHRSGAGEPPPQGEAPPGQGRSPHPKGAPRRGYPARGHPARGTPLGVPRQGRKTAGPPAARSASSEPFSLSRDHLHLGAVLRCCP